MGKAKVNVNQVERIVSAVLGGVLVTRSLTRRWLGGVAMAVGGGALLYRGISGHSYLYQTLGVNTATGRKQYGTRAVNGATDVERAITIEKPANDLYRFWRDPQNLAQIMGDFVEVTKVSEDRMHWRLRSPFAQNVEWDTQIVEDHPGELLRWKSLDGTALSGEGSVSFHPAPQDWGTEVTLHLHYDRPGGALGGNMIAKRLGIVPGIFAEKVLRRFKSLIETGEIPTLEHNPAARPYAIPPLERILSLSPGETPSPERARSGYPGVPAQ
ncbi:MAG TPA: SRPBCC family protein [Ktedonobacteraceae bacterium]|jgi:uncharacterized membrane protein|nr:SRPBCC family protein [Ktedonobacteraceae bacterium]